MGGTIVLMILPSVLGHHFPAADISKHGLELLYPAGAIVSSIGFFVDIKKTEDPPAPPAEKEPVEALNIVPTRRTSCTYEESSAEIAGNMSSPFAPPKKTVDRADEESSAEIAGNMSSPFPPPKKTVDRAADESEAAAQLLEGPKTVTASRTVSERDNTAKDDEEDPNQNAAPITSLGLLGGRTADNSRRRLASPPMRRLMETINAAA